ncbi:MAG: hypothetical protein ACC661_01785, partial [Verrucomicrobiales bacterium]
EAGLASRPKPHTGGERGLESGRVIGLKPEYGLVVLDIGNESGVQVGMPLEVIRSDRVIASALVIDVRSAICGAVIRELAAKDDFVKTGDQVRLQAQQTL